MRAFLIILLVLVLAAGGYFFFTRFEIVPRDQNTAQNGKKPKVKVISYEVRSYYEPPSDSGNKSKVKSWSHDPSSNADYTRNDYIYEDLYDESEYYFRAPRTAPGYVIGPPYYRNYYPYFAYSYDYLYQDPNYARQRNMYSYAY